MQIRNLTEEPGALGLPSWSAELVEGDFRLAVDRHAGSWIARPEDRPPFHLPHDVAARLQSKVAPVENRRRRAREAELAALADDAPETEAA